MPLADTGVLQSSGADAKMSYLSARSLLRRELYSAMKRAGIPRVGPTGEKRTFITSARKGV